MASAFALVVQYAISAVSKMSGNVRSWIHSTGTATSVMPLLIFAVSATLVAQSDRSRVHAESRSSTPNPHEIVAASIAATDRSWKARAHYTYTERDEDRRLDADGDVKSNDVDISSVIFVNGVPVEQLMEHNGLPPTAREQRKLKEKLNKLKRETLADRAARLLVEAEDATALIREVPLAFDFKIIGEEAVNGRATYLLRATPHSGYRPRGKYGNMLSKVQGNLWVDKQDLGWIKADGEVIEPLSIGLFLGRLLPGSRLKMEQTRVAEGLWMPKQIEARASVRILFIKSLIIDRMLTYSDYQPAQTGLGW